MKNKDEYKNELDCRTKYGVKSDFTHPHIFEFQIFAKLVVLLMFLTAGQARAQDNKNDSLNILYQTYANATGKERVRASEDIVQWLVNEGLIPDTLISNSLPVKEFEIEVLRPTILYLFRFEFFSSTLEAASEIIRLSEAASDTSSLILGTITWGIPINVWGIWIKDFYTDKSVMNFACRLMMTR